MCKCWRFRRRAKDDTIDMISNGSQGWKSSAKYEIQSLVEPNNEAMTGFQKEVEEARKHYPSYSAKHRTLYRSKSLSISKLDTTDFTELIKLPTGRFKTKEDVLKAKGYRLKEKCGRGGYGVVWRAQFKDGREDCAIKIINLRNRTSYEHMIVHLKTEIYIMERYTHPNIITLLDHFVIDDNAFIVMQFATDGSLADLVEKRGALPELVAFQLFVQILRGLIHLHAHQIAHRDLKLDNVLLRRSKLATLKHAHIDSLTAKLTDFGLSSAAYRPRQGYIKSGNFAGTPGYMAPEIIRLQVFDDLDSQDSLECNPFKSDVWALGVCLYEMLTTSLPFHSVQCDLKSMFKAQMSGNWTDPPADNTSDAVRDLLRKLMEPCPAVRLDPVAIWFHQWLQEAPIYKETKTAGIVGFFSRMKNRLFRR